MFPLAQLKDIYAMVTGAKPFSAHDALMDGSVLMAAAADWFPANPIVAPPVHATVAPFHDQLKALIEAHESGNKTAAAINWGGILSGFLQWLVTQIPNILG